MSTDEAWNAYQLANMADCYSPDSNESPGATFLLGIAEHVTDVGEDWDEDSAHEIADAAVPIYTHQRWQTFVDLGAYREDPTELGATADDMEGAAGIALYMIAERLAYAIHEEDNSTDDDTDEDES